MKKLIMRGLIGEHSMEIAHTSEETEYLLEDCTEVETALGAIDVYIASRPRTEDLQVYFRNRLFLAALRMGHTPIYESIAPERLSLDEARLCVEALRWSLRRQRRGGPDPFADITTELLSALEPATIRAH
jgi:hypothetical protein